MRAVMVARAMASRGASPTFPAFWEQHPRPAHEKQMRAPYVQLMSLDYYSCTGLAGGGVGRFIARNERAIAFSSSHIAT
jgi:hypothetical protein